ncbi:hypothetical protein CLAFUW4_11572 [Fulvia fulva]|uniref:Peptidase A1 domain-containing protein n=1 Tax=Passalora fulva TaxID=5499 RepID=A0A9Q8PBQ0_PASFU|nr:uncharacterized protein CLAFUR5_10615 [Fulvia fulva]KAK4619599.1 hypothetical protein CLAFUR4_11577 [Fulvia fulva]KAK4620870.1 hypothetical protein CLAFUR0_11586 [Fulvia fulva]UJO19549.1 hypothetical protein CLAFUR5_10615 [Fulvia fulva]WPV17336.1 hypothetical protein CLAFUW4_11572 [Fulvia fulva]WPV32686.1 hypothetical protein CLAFUW7_11576 [Fulvia fulva]
MAGFWISSLSAILVIHARNARAYVEMSWNTSYYFGPDGPWQAVTLGVQNNRTSQLHTVNLLPAENSLRYTQIPTPDVCALPNATEYCGIGGTMDFPNVFTNTSLWTSNDEYFTSGVVANVMLNSGTMRANDVAVAPVTNRTNSHTRYPTGDVPGLEIGFFYAGASPSSADCSIDGCSFAQGLEDSNQISSTSYGLHVGSASLEYAGSLILGGYDRSRIAGPSIAAIAGSVNSYGALDPNSFRLQDIIIGVESGASPFAFTNKTGLLHGSDSSTAQPLPVILEPSSAYIGLPQDAVTNIAAELPVTHDETTGYYLWNTADPSYSDIVMSTSYLGFVFRTTTTSGQNTNVNIKVPFPLLNLTLEPRASGLESSVPYLPIVVRERTSYEFYNFGRAFLQAAFLFEDSSDNTTILAQAPGPNINGSDIRDYDPSSSLDIPSDPSIFTSSWAGIWTPLPSTSSPSASSGLSSGAKAGIATGTIAGVALLVVIAFFILQRRRRSSGKPAMFASKEGKPQSRWSWRGVGRHRQIVTPPVELHGTSSGAERVEIDGRELYDVKIETPSLVSPLTPGAGGGGYHAR